MRGGRKGWNTRLHVLVVSYNYDKRIPPQKEEPKCVLKEARGSHIIVN